MARSMEGWSRGPLLRVALLVLLVIAGFAIVRFSPFGEYATEQQLVAALSEIRGIWWAPLVLLGLYALLAPLGVSMVPLIVTGAVFGPLLGTLYNTTGLVVGALASFWLARSLGRAFVVQITGEKFRKVERLADRHGFWPLVQTRFLPLPFPVVNFGAAMAGIRPGRFLLASVIGLIPSTFIHSFFISGLMFAEGQDRLYYGLTYGGAFLGMNLIIGIPWIRVQRRRKARYQALLAHRAARGPDSGGML